MSRLLRFQRFLCRSGWFLCQILRSRFLRILGLLLVFVRGSVRRLGRLLGLGCLFLYLTYMFYYIYLNIPYLNIYFRIQSSTQISCLRIPYIPQKLIFGTTFAASAILRYSRFLNPYIDANHLPGTIVVMTL